MMEQMNEIRKNQSSNLTIEKMLEQLDKFDNNSEIVIDGTGYQDYIISCEKIYKEYPEWREEYSQLYFDNSFGSYRGYYEDMYLGITKQENKTTVKDLKEVLNEALKEKEMYGYKGGEFAINKKTILWLDEYGHAKGIAPITFYKDNDKIILITKYID